MEILPQIINQLLVYRDTDALLDDFVSGKKTSSEILSDYTLQDYLLGYQSLGGYGTLDQQEVDYRQLADEKNRYDIFRHLLSFCEDKLIVSSSEPMCRYRHLLQWHELTRYLGEDLFTTAFLAKQDLKSSVNRTHFQWSAYLHHDNQTLNQLMSKEISELHAHLKGSTLNFEISWMSLMNDICHRRKSFLKLGAENVRTNPVQRSHHQRDLYMLVTIAAYIRLLLYKQLCEIPTDQEKDTNQLIQLMNITHSDYAVSERRTLQASIDIVRHQYGHHYRKGSLYEIPDYAIPVGEKGLLAVLTGERWLLYTMFRQEYDRSGGHHYYFSLLFYIYLHIKSVFRNELIQTNPTIGFHNFSIYESRKELFIPEDSVYERLMTFLAFGTFLDENPTKRYMEGRITPKDTFLKNLQGLNKMESTIVRNTYGVETKNWRHAYIYHFIKRKDRKIKPDLPRHQSLRKDVENQAKAIRRIAEYTAAPCHCALGIDAANSEIYCRPEVFAQAFRFLRHESSQLRHRKPLGVTYHVGEDFYDLVSGLRAVSEVLSFLGFRANDRLGHGLVLGTDVKTYYEKRHYEVRATKHELLDNAVWLCFQGQKIAGSEPVCHFLYDYAHRQFLEIYQKAHFDINDYFDAWLLRGDAPELYLQNHDDLKPLSSYMYSLDPWQRYALNDHKKATAARENPQARYLYAMYHYNNHVREEGNKADTFCLPCHIRAAFVSLLEQVQQRLLTKIERLHIAIECNPTSNYKIGEMERYDEHPILKFYNFGIHTPFPHHEVCVSINTDDAGIFATSLEREYALMALALEKRQDESFGNTPRAVVEWLNNIRKMSVEQRFVL